MFERELNRVLYTIGVKLLDEFVEVFFLDYHSCCVFESFLRICRYGYLCLFLNRQLLDLDVVWRTNALFVVELRVGLIYKSTEYI